MSERLRGYAVFEIDSRVFYYTEGKTPSSGASGSMPWPIFNAGNSEIGLTWDDNDRFLVVF